MRIFRFFSPQYVLRNLSTNNPSRNPGVFALSYITQEPRIALLYNNMKHTGQIRELSLQH